MKTLTCGESEKYIKDVLSKNVIYSKQVKKRVYSKGGFEYVNYYNIPCSFDIETSSFYSAHEEKQAIMYIWSMAINEAIFFGRTWESFINVCEFISDYLRLNTKNILVFYIHNLSFEFQWFRKYFDWHKVFSIDTRKPIYAISSLGIEFRCSYLLSGYSLSKVADNLTKYKIKKLVGDLDYSLIRTPLTSITYEEMQYCYNDVLIIIYYIKEQIEKCGDITKIPLTKTGFVRQYCRSKCLPKDDKKLYYRYMNLMKELTIDVEEYRQLKRAFQGGFTHANAFSVDKILHDVGSFDFTSAYPFVMISEKFPMSKAELVEIKTHDEFIYNINNYCCMFDIEFTNIISKLHQETPLSYSRCSRVVNATINNGRIVSANSLSTTITDCDYKILYNFYDWKECKIYNFRRYKKAYLPTPFVKAILDLYGAKTMLKGVDGMEAEYMSSKEDLNSAYGMCVTDPCRDLITYISDEWGHEEFNEMEAIENHNKSTNRFLYYPWGVWVTAYCRKNLFTGIIEFANDYVYSDTDSIKGMNPDKHMDYIAKYNENCIKKLDEAMNYHGLPKELYKPKTIKGDEKILGVWDFEGIYKRFKTLGAKRYIVEKDDNINLTVSGVNKKVAMPYLLSKGDPFELFKDGLEIPPDYSGKNIHSYIDDEMSGTVTDYMGVNYNYHELSGVHLEATTYNLSIASMFGEYLAQINGKR